MPQRVSRESRSGVGATLVANPGALLSLVGPCRQGFEPVWGDVGNMWLRIRD